MLNLTSRNLALLACLGLAACGQAVSAKADTPVAVVTGYLNAIDQGDSKPAQQYLEPKSDEVLTGDTPASRFMAKHKGTKWEILKLPGFEPGSSKQIVSETYCLVGQPLPSQICLVTVQVGTTPPAFFRFAVEQRYEPGQWHIISVSQVASPTDELPSGNESHLS